MKQTAIEWLINEHFGDIENCTPDFKFKIEQAKKIEKQQIIDAINNVSKNNVKYVNMIVSSWSQIEGELFMHNTKQAEQYYNETYKNK